MKAIIPTFFFISLSIRSLAFPSIDWMKMPDMLANSGTSIALDSINNVYTTTSTAGSIVLEKRDRFGNFKWQVTSSTTISFNYEYPVQVFVDPQGNPVVLGYRHTHSSDGNNANAIIYLKYDPSGLLLFKRIITGTFSYFHNSRYWTNVSGQMDKAGNFFIGVAGNVGGSPDWGFNVIKLDNSGLVLHTNTRNYPSSLSFHYVIKIRVRDNRVGITGVTSSSTANATTWVLDSAGNTLWDNISTGGQGKDLLFDAAGNTYMLTTITTSFSGDVVLYKFDISGNQIWTQNYDFGGSEISNRMEYASDSTISIIATGNTAPGGSYYVDWITCKVDTSGNQLWFDRYDEHTNNDESPGMMKVDASGNIYVTGIGGPFPGGSNLGKRQLVTVKYTSNGVRDWASPIDTLNEYNTGVGLAIGYDSSIFVLGDVNTFIVHYFDHTGTGTCQIPSGMTSTVLSDDSVFINWTAVPGAYLYHVEYKTATATTWIRLSTDSASIVISDLYAGTLYDFRVEAICNSGPTGFITPQQFTTTGSGYCLSRGLDASKEWIDLVFIETLLNSTIDSDSGYADYTHLNTTLVPGNTYDITLSAEIIGGPFTESWKVWIDFNKDGDFTDVDEEVVSYTSQQIGWETHSIQVPPTVQNGQTIMRVSMKNGALQAPCDTFQLGEVEDYTIIFSGVTSVNETDHNGFFVYPNPARNDLNIHSKENSYAKVVDMEGRILFERKISGNQTIDVSKLTRGMYVIQVIDEAGTCKMIKWVKNER